MERKVGEACRKVSCIQQLGTSLRSTFTEHNFSLRIGYTPRSRPDIRGPHALTLHLHVVVENNVREHDLEPASCEVASRTRMTPVSKRQELWGGGNNILFLTILLEPHFREAEAVKLFGIFVRFRVMMCMCKIDTNCSSLRNTGAIRECVILPGNSLHCDCFCQRKVYTGWSGTHNFPTESFAATP